MKLIIDIPEKSYKLRLTNPMWYDSNIDKAIRNGTPLPKGHGRLDERIEDLIDTQISVLKGEADEAEKHIC